jgi:hypothetical protein
LSSPVSYRLVVVASSSFDFSAVTGFSIAAGVAPAGVCAVWLCVVQPAIITPPTRRMKHSSIIECFKEPFILFSPFAIYL